MDWHLADPEAGERRGHDWSHGVCDKQNSIFFSIWKGNY